jgi:hypothetical protein
MEIIQKFVELFKYTSVWFNNNILSGSAGFIKALGLLLIKIFQLFIDIIQWVISRL